jgi:peptidoglycan/LPS O-acetylase OafA/YrhL
MNRKDCSVLRGIAILCIILHNYCHWLPFAVHENEFSFNLDNYFIFWNSIQWNTILFQFFSFWGHFGVPVFVMLSGYGLVLKYDKTTINKRAFILKHYKKLCIPMIVGLIFYYIIQHVINYSGHFDVTGIIPVKKFIAQITLIINLLPHPQRLIHPGPYWYFSITMQLYIIYLFLVYKQPTKYITIIAISLFIFSCLLKQHQQILTWTKYNAIGWLLPFVYGIIVGRTNNRHSNHQAILVSAFIFLLIPIFGFTYFTWLLIPLLIALAANNLVTFLPKCLIYFFDVIGEKSLYIFVLHPIARELTIRYGATNPYLGIILYIILTFILVYIIMIISKLIMLGQQKNNSE